MSVTAVELDSDSARTPEKMAELRRTYIDDLAAQDPLVASKMPAIRSADICRTTILWPGVIHDVVSFASFVVCVTTFPALVRASTRRWRPDQGICSKCRYDLTGLPQGTRCPECGFAKPDIRHPTSDIT
jgi:hypothetical protein